MRGVRCFISMDYLLQILRDNPVIPIFLTLGLGYWIGNKQWKSFSLGPVTATLIVGVVVGQLDIPVSDTLKQVAFMLFLFAIGYSVGPQFFRSLKGDGLKQIYFALIEGVLCMTTCIVAAWLMGWNKGMAIGLFAGSQTVSATIGVGIDTLKSLDIDPLTRQQMTHIIPAAYAVTYVFGTIGAAWVIANLGPHLFGGVRKVREQTAQLEAEMDSGDIVPEVGKVLANRPISFRAYRCEGEWFNKQRSIDELERKMHRDNQRHFVERIRSRGEIMDPEPQLKICKGDVVVLSGRRESIVDNTDWIGPEVSDHDLLNFDTENLAVTVSKSGAAGKRLAQLRVQPFMRGVHIRKILRNDLPVPVRRSTVLERGDVVTLVGLPQDVAEAVPQIGYSDPADGKTDMVFLSLGIALGCFVGALGFFVDGIPVSLSTSGGAILAGLVMGWWRSRRPSVGHIPRSVISFMNGIGLNLFIALVGLGAGPTFLSGLREVGLPMFIVGIICTTVPLVLSLIIGVKLFRFPVAVAMGCVAGARNAVAALGAIEESVDSTIPMLGYTVTYAVSSVFLIFAGMVVPLLTP